MDIQDWIETAVRAFFCFVGIIGNFWLGLRSLPKSRSQVRTSDIFFINLALSNLITNCLVDLPEFISHFEKGWVTSKAYCGVTQFCSELSETSSIFSTMFITMYWHQKLVGSIKRGGAPVQLDSLRLVFILLGVSWSVSLVFSSPHIFITENEGNQSIEICEERFPTDLEKQTFDALYLTLANVIPIIGINYASIRITVTLLQSHKRISNRSNWNRSGTNPAPVEQKAEETSRRSQAASKTENNGNNPPQTVQKTQVRSNLSSNNQVRAAKSVVAVATIFICCWFSHLVLRIYRSFNDSVLAVKLTNFIAAFYLCFVPYIYLHGVRKLNCSCW